MRDKARPRTSERKAQGRNPVVPTHNHNMTINGNAQGLRSLVASSRPLAASARAQKGTGLMRKRHQVVAAIFATSIATSTLTTVSNVERVSAASHPVGIYSGPAYVAEHDAFAGWLGSEVPYASDALDYRFGWNDIANPSWLIEAWSPWVKAAPNRRLVLSVPLLPESARGQLSAGAAGSFDSSFRTLAENLVRGGLGNSIIRLGWEANGTWFPWSAAPDPSSWKTFFRRTVTNMRSVPGAAFSFDWNPVSSSAGTNLSFDAFYPGDDVVDIIGLDAYDLKWQDSTSSPEQRWQFTLTQFNGLNAHKVFAQAHGKPMSYPEWGMYLKGDAQGGGGDNPYYVDEMANWFATNNVVYQSYFNWGAYALANFPNGKARYKARFGTAATTSTTISTTTTTTTTLSDTTPPTQPTALSAIAGKQTMNLTWGASMDATGVVGYDIYRSIEGGPFTKVAASTSPFYSDERLRRRRLYAYFVQAFDAAGNRSKPSSTVRTRTW